MVLLVKAAAKSALLAKLLCPFVARQPFSAASHAQSVYRYPLRPSEPATGECCGSDCRDCVWTQFSENLQGWEEGAARDALLIDLTPAGHDAAREGGEGDHAARLDEGQRWIGRNVTGVDRA
jgi:hypothetical protein